jgi:hypothetical protein
MMMMMMMFTLKRLQRFSNYSMDRWTTLHGYSNLRFFIYKANYTNSCLSIFYIWITSIILINNLNLLWNSLLLRVFLWSREFHWLQKLGFQQKLGRFTQNHETSANTVCEVAQFLLAAQFLKSEKLCRWAVLFKKWSVLYRIEGILLGCLTEELM